MKRAFELIVLVLGLAIIAMPTVNMIHPFLPADPPIEGAVAETKRPAFSGSGLLKEDYQKQLTAWYEQHYTYRPTATRIDNSIEYYLFNEMRPDKTVKVGRDKYLFHDDQISFNNRRDDAPATFVAYGKVARMTQDALAKRHISMVISLLPSKASFFRDKIPDSLSLPLGDPRPCDVNLYEPFVKVMVNEGVHFIDGRRLLAERFGGQRDLIYSSTGRHLNAPAACVVLDESYNLIREEVEHARPGKVLPHLDCRSTPVLPPTPFAEEYDLLRLLNVFDNHPTRPIAEMVTVPESVPPLNVPDTVFVGSSFAWKMMAEAERNHSLGHIHYVSYNVSFTDRAAIGPLVPMPKVGTPEWLKIVLEKELIILPTIEEYLPYHNSDILLDILHALGVDTHELDAALKSPF